MWLHLNAKKFFKNKRFWQLCPYMHARNHRLYGVLKWISKERKKLYIPATDKSTVTAIISQFCFNITYDPIQASGCHQLCNFYWGFYWQRDYVLQISGLLVKLFYASCDSRQERNWAIIISNTYWSHIYQDLSTKVDFCQVFVIWIVELDDISCSWIFHHQPSCGDICVWWSWLKRIDF